MDLRRGRQGRTRLGRPQLARTRRGAARAGACAAAFSLAAALCGAAPGGAALAGAGLGGAASASTGSGGGQPGGPAVAKICAEPSSGAVLTTGSHRKPAGAPAAAIRVDQVGYPSGAAKVAEIMTKARPSGDLPGGGLRWVLVRAGSCTVAASGLARQNLGAWSKRYGWVWAARFSQVRAPGRYRVGILGDASAASPWFAIGSAARLYAQPLANALYFYENERDGPDFIHTALRSAPGHLNDASAMTYRTPPVDGNGNFKGSLAKYATGVRINATGGWFDAGDYLHFVETTSYTEAVLLQGVASFPRQMGSRSGTDFTGEVKFGLDFLRRMWHERSRTLYYEVGTGEANSYYFADHDIWRLPQADDHYRGTNPHYLYVRHPPVFRAGRPGAKLSPNLAGRLAADFALCYQVLRHSDPGYADGCLRSAETVYSLADPQWKGHLMTAIPWDFYPETSWRDDMMLGATELARALQEAGHPAALPAGLPVRSAGTYLRDAASWASAWIHSKQALADTLNLYDVSALADYELVLTIRAQHATGLAVTTAQLLADLRGQIEKGIRIGAKDPFRFGFAWDQWDTTTHGAGLTVMADEYDALRPARVRGLGAALAGRHPGQQRVGSLADRRGRDRVPRLHAAPGGEPGRIAGRAAARPRRGGGRGTELVRGHRHRTQHAALRGQRPRQHPLRGVQRGEGRVRRQCAVLLHGGAGHRPDRHDPAGLRLAAERSAVVPCAVSR